MPWTESLKWDCVGQEHVASGTITIAIEIDSWLCTLLIMLTFINFSLYRYCLDYTISSLFVL